MPSAPSKLTAASALKYLAWIVGDGPIGWHATDFVLAAIFPVAHLVLLLHPMSREHQRIWFR